MKNTLVRSGVVLSLISSSFCASAVNTGPPFSAYFLIDGYYDGFPHAGGGIKACPIFPIFEVDKSKAGISSNSDMASDVELMKQISPEAFPEFSSSLQSRGWARSERTESLSEEDCRSMTGQPNCSELTVIFGLALQGVDDDGKYKFEGDTVSTFKGKDEDEITRTGTRGIRWSGERSVGDSIARASAGGTLVFTKLINPVDPDNPVPDPHFYHLRSYERAQLFTNNEVRTENLEFFVKKFEFAERHINELIPGASESLKNDGGDPSEDRVQRLVKKFGHSPFGVFCIARARFELLNGAAKETGSVTPLAIILTTSNETSCPDCNRLTPTVEGSGGTGSGTGTGSGGSGSGGIGSGVVPNPPVRPVPPVVNPNGPGSGGAGSGGTGSGVVSNPPPVVNPNTPIIVDIYADLPASEIKKLNTCKSKKVTNGQSLCKISAKLKASDLLAPIQPLSIEKKSSLKLQIDSVSSKTPGFKAAANPNNPVNNLANRKTIDLKLTYDRNVKTVPPVAEFLLTAWTVNRTMRSPAVKFRINVRLP